MIDLINDVLMTSRVSERAIPLVNLANILYNVGYEAELDEVATYISIHDGVAETGTAVENIIAKCTRSVLLKLGIDIDIYDINANTEHVLYLLTAILEDIEAYEDVDAILNILESDDTNIVKMNDIVMFINADAQSVLLDIMVSVSDNLITVTRQTLEATRDDVIVDESDVLNRLDTFLTRCNNNPLVELLDDYGYRLATATLIDLINIDPEETDNYTDVIADTVAGIIMVKHMDLPTMLDQIDPITDQLLDDSHGSAKLTVTHKVMTLLNDVVAEEQINEEA